MTSVHPRISEAVEDYLSLRRARFSASTVQNETLMLPPTGTSGFTIGGDGRTDPMPSSGGHRDDGSAGGGLIAGRCAAGG